MACYHPLSAYRSRFVSKNGKRPLTWNKAEAYVDLPVTVPCGQCIGCRLEKSRQWALRLMHEAQLHEQKCFITLTYDPAKIPENGSLRYRDFQLFMKRLRKEHGGKIRFFMCGEYGDSTGRPHYHAFIYGCDFPDRKKHSENSLGNILWKSEALERLWGFGHCLIGDCSFQSAAYIARYVIKKVNGDRKESHYRRVNPITGEIHQIEPEFIKMSLKPGIGADWYAKYKTDVFPSDFAVFKGRRLAVPKFYFRKLEAEDPKLHRRLKSARVRRAARYLSDQTPERLAVRKTVQLAKTSTLKRNLE